MRSRSLGGTGLEVSEIGFGSWQLGNRSDWEAMDDATAVRLVHEALDAGVTLFDTSPNYGDTRSESLLGEALAGRRNGVVLVSKFGHLPEGPKEFSVEWFWRSLDASLRRLRIDTLDVLLLHNPPADIYAGTDPLWDAMEKARTQGRIRHYGASLDFAAEAEACMRNTGSTVLEVLFNILHQDIRGAFPLARKRKVGLIAKIPLDSGWLTGRFSARTRFQGIRSRWSPEQIARRAELVGTLGWLTQGNVPLSQQALAFVLAYDEVSCAIPGMRTSGHLQDGVAASGRTLPAAQRDRLERFWMEITSEGRDLLPW